MTRTLTKNFVLFMTFMVLLSFSSATTYKVGDSEGWYPKRNGYYSWTEHKEFHVGDSLIFEYDHNFNDVVQVSDALEYEFCDSPHPMAVYNTGHDVVTLTKPGYYYFITSNHAQCGSGQRLGVLVVNDLSRSSETTSGKINGLEIDFEKKESYS